MSKLAILKELKTLMKKITIEECEKNNILIETFPLTTPEYYCSKHFLNYIPTTNIDSFLDHITTPFHTSGYVQNNNNPNIIVFLPLLGRGKIKSNFEENLPFLLQILYHEIYHQIQKSKEYHLENYDDFILEIEKLESIQFYKKYTSIIKTEIDAEKYAATRTIEYIKENIETSLQYEKYLKFIQYVAHQKQLLYTPKLPFLDFNDMTSAYLTNNSPLINYFYNKQGNLLPFHTIMNKTNIEKLDPRIISTVFSSSAFLTTQKVSPEDYKELEKYLLLDHQQTINLENYRKEKSEEYSKQATITFSNLDNFKKIIKTIPNCHEAINDLYDLQTPSKELLQEYKILENVLHNPQLIIKNSKIKCHF